MLSVETFETIEEAAGAVGERSRFMAGGTLLMVAVNYGNQGFDRIVRTSDRRLGEISNAGDRVHIGAGVTMAKVAASRDLAFLAPAARSVGGPAIRNRATVGGNLFAPHPYGDFATALLALDATVHWADGREEPIETVLQNRGQSIGLAAAVSVPRPQADEFRFLKVARVKPKGASVMALAAWLPKSAGRLENTRIAFGAMGATAARVKACEAALNGTNLDERGIEPALQAATEGLSPQDDALASGWYRREVAPIHLKRLLIPERRL
ncbi:FAD binding domain-containing protein [Nitratireductor sp. XY-223]|uniref:FAD binding domain-containing protein n=1 Tax=Nitratireductor sp. XY-223 TaxID=2561926 RepID=UPI0010AA9D02|nr:FAD binding domain-containing protein [Nitratireductor sp. XY-223]